MVCPMPMLQKMYILRYKAAPPVLLKSMPSQTWVYNIHTHRRELCFIEDQDFSPSYDLALPPITALHVERLHCKRPIPICRLFFKIHLLTDIAALCLTETFTHWLVFSTQLVNCCPWPHGRRNYTCVLLPLYLLSYLLPPFPN